MTENAGPTRLGKFVIILFILALVVAAGYFFKDLLVPSGSSQGDIDLDEFRNEVGQFEAPDTQGITTVNEYTYVPSERLRAALVATGAGEPARALAAALDALVPGVDAGVAGPAGAARAGC